MFSGMDLLVSRVFFLLSKVLFSTETLLHKIKFFLVSNAEIVSDSGGTRKSLSLHSSINFLTYSIH